MKIFNINITFVLISVLVIISPPLLLFFRWHIFPHEINYAYLEILLKNKQWEEADRQTSIIYKQIISNHLRKLGIYGLVMLDFLGQEEAVLYMGRLPCQELKTLDRLWVKYSQGKFGFSVQAEIFNSIPSHPNKFISVDRADRYDEFEQQVGWKSKYCLYPEVHQITNFDKYRGCFPSPLWMSRSPKPIDLALPLEKFSSCIDTQLTL